jgi:hypothetical protein
MTAATADATASVHIRMPDYTYLPAGTRRYIDDYVRSIVPPVGHVSDYRPESLIYIPSPIKPSWFASNQKRIQASVTPNCRDEKNVGQWLSQEVADAAITFFQKTADLLPGEPFIYSSQLGDLVAEFKVENGTLTSIVSPTFVLLFAVIGGVPVEKRIFQGGDVRSELHRLVGMLNTGQHVAVDSTK